MGAAGNKPDRCIVLVVRDSNTGTRGSSLRVDRVQMSSLELENLTLQFSFWMVLGRLQMRTILL